MLGKPWSEKDKQILRTMYLRGSSTAQLMSRLQRSYLAIWNKIYDLHLKRRKVNRLWTASENSQLRKLFLGERLTTQKIANILGRTEPSVRAHLFVLHLKRRSEEHSIADEMAKSYCKSHNIELLEVGTNKSPYDYIVRRADGTKVLVNAKLSTIGLNFVLTDRNLKRLLVFNMPVEFWCFSNERAYILRLTNVSVSK